MDKPFNGSETAKVDVNPEGGGSWLRLLKTHASVSGSALALLPKLLCRMAQIHKGDGLQRVAAPRSPKCSRWATEHLNFDHVTAEAL